MKSERNPIDIFRGRKAIYGKPKQPNPDFRKTKGMPLVWGFSFNPTLALSFCFRTWRSKGSLDPIFELDTDQIDSDRGGNQKECNPPKKEPNDCHRIETRNNLKETDHRARSESE